MQVLEPEEPEAAAVELEATEAPKVQRGASYTHRKCGDRSPIGAALAEAYIEQGIGNMSPSVYCSKCEAAFHPKNFEWSIDGEVVTCKY